MLQRPEAQSFSRFLASIGFFLCIAAVVVPGVVLRELSVLEISRQELTEFTPVGRSELERRQRVSRDAAKAAPVAGGALLLCGVVLIVYAAPSLRRQERADEERSSAELDQLRRDLAPQDEADQEVRLAAEVDTELAAEQEQLPKPSSQQIPRVGIEPRRERMRRYAEVEARVLDRLNAIAPPRYELKARVKFSSTPSLLLDAVLVSQVDQLPDVVVEIKLSSSLSALKNARNRVNEALANVARYRRRGAPAAVAWLILVVDGELSPVGRDRVQRVASDVADDVVLTPIGETEIEALELPEAGLD